MSGLPNPIAAITNRDGTFNYAHQQVTGIGQPGSTITLVDNGTALGSTAVQADGIWTASANLLSGSNEIVATDTNSAGGTGQTKNYHAVVDLTKKSDQFGPNLQFDPDAKMKNGTTVTLSGTIDSTESFASGINIYSNGVLIGTGEADSTKHWSLDLDRGAGTLTNIEARASDINLRQSSAICPFELITGVTGQPYSSEQITHSPDGSVTNTAYYGADGALAYSGTTSLDPAGSAKTLITGAGSRVNFGINPADGHAEIVNFQAAGPDHDTLSLGGSSIHSMRQLMAHSSTIGGDTTIQLGDSSITLDGVSKATLHSHRADIAFA